MTPTQDEYGAVINTPETYRAIADELRGIGTVSGASIPVIIAWTDQAGTQLDILFCYQPDQYGRLQRGMSTNTDLFVAVSSFGMFGFDVTGPWKSPGYVGEKLHLGGDNTTTEKLADLINGLCRELGE